MTTSPKCPVCQDPLDGVAFARGRLVACPTCGERLALGPRGLAPALDVVL